MDINEIVDELSMIEHCLDGIKLKVQKHNYTVKFEKSKKTGKMIKQNECMSIALYATKKYGCSGFKGMPECLKCEYRK